MTAMTADLSRFISAYAKRFNAGGFATPLASDLDRYEVVDLRYDLERFVVLGRRLQKRSSRHDFVGRTYDLPAGTTIAQVYRSPACPVPDLDRWDVVVGYVEDASLAAGLREQGREPMGVRVSAAGEVIWTWGRAGSRWRYSPVDLTTCVQMPMSFDAARRDAAWAEVDRLTGWHDDYPYYSDGSWSALSLRGYWDDPRLGVKPQEMSKSWKRDHPSDLDRTLRWTELAVDCPELRAMVDSVSWWRDVQRVRLMRMEGREGTGVLRRHSDVTDIEAGTANGQVMRFHVPLVSHPSVTMTTWELDGRKVETHLPPWTCWYLDQRKPHAVANPSGHDRVHLVVDVIADNEVRGHVLGAAWPDLALAR